MPFASILTMQVESGTVVKTAMKNDDDRRFGEANINNANLREFVAN